MIDDKIRIEALHKDIESFMEDIKRLQIKNAKLINLQQENKQLKEKIDKAIEYIKKTNKIHNEQYGYNSLLCDELLEILGDKE